MPSLTACSDGNACTTDTCNAGNTCTWSFNIANCSDGNACTTGDACASGICKGGPLNCEDSNGCTSDACDPTSGCIHSFVSAVCNDNDKCTASDTCNGGVCAGNTVNCSDGNACTTDACNKATGCVATNADGIPCSDGSACTSADTCTGGTCIGTPLNCDDGNVCTSDACDNVTGCSHGNVNAACNDNSVCTTGDFCAAGACTGNAISCDDGNACTVDTCDPVAGCKHVTSPNGAVCGSNLQCFLGACGPVPSYVLTVAKNSNCPNTHPAVYLADGSRVCAPDYPAWGIRQASPNTYLVDSGDGMVSDKNTFLTWSKADSAVTMSLGNASAYCSNLSLNGLTDWRLPTVAELLTLRDLTTASPAVGSLFTSGTASVGYWTTVQTADFIQHWFVDFKDGQTYINPDSSLHRARCVRSPFLTSVPPGARYGADTSKGWVLDNVTGRAWQLVSQNANDFAGANTVCANLSLDGGGWRLPGIQELESLVERHIAPALDKPFASSIETDFSISVYAANNAKIWSVQFADGSSYLTTTANSAGVRCVR